MSFDTQEYIELFYQDSEENLQLMTEGLLDLENDPTNEEALGGLFRAAHTLKSSSAMVGLMHISEFTHRMEDLIQHLRDEKVRIDKSIVNLLFQAFDALKEMLEQLQDGAAEAARNDTKRRTEGIQASFSQLMNREECSSEEPASSSVRIKMDEAVRCSVEEMKLAGDQIYEIALQFKPDTAMVSARALLIFNELSERGTVITMVPDLDNDEEVEGDSVSFLLASQESLEDVSSVLNMADIESRNVRDVTEAEQFDWANDAAPSTAADEDPEKKKSGGETAKSDATLSSFDRREDRQKTQTVRVNIEKLDRLLNLAAEMVIQRGRVLDLCQNLIAESGNSSVKDELLDVVVKQGMFLGQLQETIMEARMVPIGSVFSRFRRVVRDLATERGKKVNLVVKGEETELDKKIIDQIGDPLMHMIRNSVDHGLETKEERTKQGKPPEGLLHLDAVHQGNSIVITVRDDGRGIDSAAVAKKAIEKNILTEEEAAGLSEKETLQLIFKAGFSTAQEVTDISGRGVGMDVVRRSLEQLGGTIDIETTPGAGTAFHLKLPLTLAIIQALLVEANEELYALPIAQVSETIRVTEEEIYSVKEQGKVLRIRDTVVPVLDLRAVVSKGEAARTEERNYMAVLKHNGASVGLLVDRMVNEQEVVIKPLTGNISNAPYIAGASILGNGSVILILDTATLIESRLGAVA